MIDFIRATGCPKCPQCGGRMVKYKDNVGRRWCKCFRCSVNIPLESGFREVKDESKSYTNRMG